MEMQSLEILLLEDNPTDALLIREMLAEGRKKHSLFPTCHLQWSKTLAESEPGILEGKFHVVLLDLSLPDAEGLESVDFIGRRAPSLPIVVITGFDDKDLATSSLKKGVQDYLMKGEITPDLLLRSILYAIQRKESEKSLIREKNRLKKYLDVAPVMFIVLDKEGRIRQINRKGCQVLGYEEEDLLGQSLWENHIEPTSQAEFRAVFSSIVSGDRQTVEHVEIPIVTRTGEERIIDWSYQLLLDSKDEPGGVISSGDDITLRKRLQKTLHESEKLKAIGQLAGGIAHDFNNILMTIMGNANLSMLEVEPGEKVHESLSVISDAVQRAATLVRQLLSFSGRKVLEPVSMNLNEVVENLVRFLKPVLGEGIELVVQTEPHLWPITADVCEMEHLLMNLCVNARDAMPEGGRLVIRTRNVALDHTFSETHPTAQPGNYCLLTVEDTGVGIPPEHFDRIFEPFFTTKPEGKGTGLGLASVFGTVNQHGGFVVPASTVGKGTRFSIYLPANEQMETVSAGRSTGPAELVGGTETVLVVEDDKSLRVCTEKALVKAGYNVLTAVDGIDAVRQFENKKQKVDFVLLDMVLPKQSGLAAARQIRNLSPDVPILFATGYARESLQATDDSLKGIDVIEKPCSPDKLLARIRGLLDGKGSTEGKGTVSPGRETGNATGDDNRKA